ncbi:SCO2400 family protein [Streptomyces lateritius]|uniref:SCO2400 family protein n=1 Tax=Streptomyces lateritius TaxID=67313 RepID=UPI001675FE6F|nr:hypothetical protein [Streptomyces lateritius]GGU16164.1 hypothetical protein GCM10010272_70960 [Streptomyces lateritius]
MDYCHQCRRHLNGALACAGCGTPVEELRYETPQTTEYGAAAEHVYELDLVEPPRPAPGGRRAARRAAVGPAASGRATSRKGRRARSRRGRNVLVGTLGLVLAAGTLSLAKVALEPPNEGGAATAVREEEVVETSLPPVPSETSAPSDGPSPVDGPASVRPTVSRGATGADSAGSGSGSGSGSGVAGPGGAGSGNAQGSGDGAPGPSEEATPSGSPSASSSETGPTPSESPSQPGATPTGPPDGGPTTPPPPTRTPEPTKSTCVLFWCW